MKKTYLPPETEILSLVTDSTFICASGEDLLEHIYGEEPGESAEDFWG